jgi:hypothetical protein
LRRKNVNSGDSNKHVVHDVNRKYLLAGAILLITVAASVWQMNHHSVPEPTEHERGEDEDQGPRRAQWIEHMHRRAPGTDWRAQDAATLARLQPQRAMRLHATSQVASTSAQASAPAGIWVERGASNWAGRASAFDFDPATDRLTVFAHGGQLWRARRAMLDWHPLNDTRHFEPFNTIQNFLRLAAAGAAPERLLVADDTRHGFYYSDDDGASWTQASGNMPGNWVETTYLVARHDGSGQLYALVEDYNFDANAYQMHLLVSNDRGARFTDLGFVGSTNKVALFAPDQQSALVYLLANTTLKRIEVSNALSTVATITGTPAQAEGDKVGLAGGITAGATPTPFLYAFFEADDKTRVFRSLDAGAHWQATGTVNATANIRMTPATALHDPNLVFFGGVNLWRSTDGGATFTSNDWAEYYDNPAHKLHADISFVRSVIDASGKEVFFVGTDGGIYESTDALATVVNDNLTGMRQAQYYDSYTSRLPPHAISVGSQDQGYQRNEKPGAGLLAFQQIIAGDYAHLTSSDGGKTIWSVYAGFAQIDPAPDDPQRQILPEWDFKDDGELQNMLFLPPIMADPSHPDSAWLGGGASTDGLDHVVKLDWNGVVDWKGQITGSEGNFDFGGQVTALGNARGDFYAMADNAGGSTSFFRTTTPLGSWTRTVTNLPQGQYFYGQAILPDPARADVIYICGSGYSGPGVYVSTDNGTTFTPMANGLPNTFVYALAISPDGSKLFAATGVGPFYFDRGNSAWIDIGAGAPDNTYWGVDYVPALNLARFSTYGRGLWDYVMTESSDMQAQPLAPSQKSPPVSAPGIKIP